jgi:type IV pilus assembly protein PilA
MKGGIVKRGFTLLELLVVVLIIGVLAAIAIPKFSGTRDKAYLTSMKSDLRNLIIVQEAYLADGGTYASAVGSLVYRPSSGVTVTIGAADSSGWNATAAHTGTSRTCGIFIGTAAAPVAGANAGEAVCA